MNKNLVFSVAAMLFFSLIMSFFPSSLFAQNANIIIKVIDKQKDPVPFATVRVSEEKDSGLKFEKVTDSLGVADFQLLHQHKYIVSITAVNHTPLKQGIAFMSNEAVFTFILDNKTTTLDAVVIKSTKPLMRQEDDKTIVDPESLASSSSSGYEVIEKIPGIFMDQDGNIYLNSTTPASVYINGREQKMSTADIASILKSLPPNSIASIEILRTPSAKYDASGSGGVINVILKKELKLD